MCDGRWWRVDGGRQRKHARIVDLDVVRVMQVMGVTSTYIYTIKCVY